MRGKNLNLEVGPLRIKWVDKSDIDGLKPVGSKYPSTAQAWRYKVQSPDNWSLVLAYLVFEGEQEKRDIRILECSDGTPEYIRRLRNGLRMSVSRVTGRGKDWVELSQAQPKRRDQFGQLGSEWSTLKQAEEDQLDQGAGFRLRPRIQKLGGSFGLRKDILEEARTRNNYYCVIFLHNDHSIPISCYIATRVLPLLNQVQKTLSKTAKIHDVTSPTDAQWDAMK